VARGGGGASRGPLGARVHAPLMAPPVPAEPPRHLSPARGRAPPLARGGGGASRGPVRTGDHGSFMATPVPAEPSCRLPPARAPARAASDRPPGRVLRAACGRALPVARGRGEASLGPLRRRVHVSHTATPRPTEPPRRLTPRPCVSTDSRPTAPPRGRRCPWPGGEEDRPWPGLREGPRFPHGHAGSRGAVLPPHPSPCARTGSRPAFWGLALAPPARAVPLTPGGPFAPPAAGRSPWLQGRDGEAGGRPASAPGPPMAAPGAREPPARPARGAGDRRPRDGDARTGGPAGRAKGRAAHDIFRYPAGESLPRAPPSVISRP